MRNLVDVCRLTINRTREAPCATPDHPAVGAEVTGERAATQGAAKRREQLPTFHARLHVACERVLGRGRGVHREACLLKPAQFAVREADNTRIFVAQDAEHEISTPVEHGILSPSIRIVRGRSKEPISEQALEQLDGLWDQTPALGGTDQRLI